MTVVINAENISKKYIIGHQLQQRYPTIRDAIADYLKNIFNNHKEPKQDKEEFWALQDISFEINQGDKIGIIGRNGAGKSTLLKILSKITEPTTGRIKIKGRVSSLLEVGTGFHPELTGRENIYLNGAILGMKKSEIKRKFDEIVAFSEVEKFLDTPVKRYSSGMYVRLAFAVAAHLEPDILIIDEVLAVGDAQFQKKCLGKMDEVGNSGRTVLFVSHNMNAIEHFCNKGILLEKGKLKLIDNDVRNVVRYYLNSSDGQVKEARWINTENQFDNPYFKPLEFYLSDENGNPLSMPVTNNADIWVNIKGQVEQLDNLLIVGYALFDEDNRLLYWSCTTDENEGKWPKLEKGINHLRSKLPERFLNEGSYRIELLGGLYYVKWFYEPGVNSAFISIDIQGGLSDSPYWQVKRPGILAPVTEWNNIKSGDESILIKGF